MASSTRQPQLQRVRHAARRHQRQRRFRLGGVLVDSDTIAISLTPDGFINGTSDNDTLGGTGGPDTFLLQDGGNETVTGNGGNDYFYFNGTLTAADHVDGGAGADVVGLCGNHNMTLGADNLVNVERLTLLSGTIIGGPHVTYTLASVDANVAAGQTLTVLGSSLLADETMIFNGSAESDGHFYIGGGAANDILVGGQQSDALVGGGGADASGEYSRMLETEWNGETQRFRPALLIRIEVAIHKSQRTRAKRVTAGTNGR